VHQLHREEMNGLGLSVVRHRRFDAVDRDDVRMIEGGDRLGFTLKALATIGVVGHLWRKHLEGHLALEPGILGRVDLAHAAGAQPAENPIVTQSYSDH
jgi:hypothetical protein